MDLLDISILFTNPAQWSLAILAPRHLLKRLHAIPREIDAERDESTDDLSSRFQVGSKCLEYIFRMNLIGIHKADSISSPIERLLYAVIVHSGYTPASAPEPSNLPTFGMPNIQRPI
jgi:hypothetical protein